MLSAFVGQLIPKIKKGASVMDITVEGHISNAKHFSYVSIVYLCFAT